MSMTEEEFSALEEIIDAKCKVLLEDAAGRDSCIEDMQYRELRQEFINTFIFGD